MKHNLIMPFIDPSNSFTNGFEIGQIWEQMQNYLPFQKKLVHAVNREQIALMCEHFGYEWFIEEYDQDWEYFTAIPIDISSITNS